MKDISAYNIGKLQNEAVQKPDGTFSFTEGDPIKAFLQCIAKGMPVKSACKYAMLDFNVVKNWLEIGKKDFELDLKTDYRNLYEREQRAEAVFEGRMLETITTAAQNGNWNSSAWLLERRINDTYSNKQEIKLEDDGVVIHMDVPKK